ncbi:MAG: phosphorylase family protein [Thermoplasmatota archaeon]
MDSDDDRDETRREGRGRLRPRELAAGDDEREIVTAAAALARRAEHPGAQLGLGDADERAMLLWGRSLLPEAIRFSRAEPTQRMAGEAELYRGKWGGVAVTIAAPGIGAPATALVAEKLAAAGAKVIVGVGFAGSIHPLVASGTALAVEAALSDEGTSRHYVADGAPLLAHRPLADALELALADEGAFARCAKVWTTDAPYRETVAKARAFRLAGAVAVEMETAALLAVAARRGFHAGAALLVADELTRFDPGAKPEGIAYAWRPAAPGALDRARGQLLRAAFAALTGDAALSS